MPQRLGRAPHRDREAGVVEHRRRRTAAVPVDVRDAFGTIPDADRATERVRIVRHHDLPGIELWDARSSTRLWTVYHTEYRFCASFTEVSPGEQLWRYRGRIQSLMKGCSFLLEPGEVHETLRAPRADFVVLGLDPGWLAEHACGLTRRGPVHFRTGQLPDHEAEHLLKRCARALCSGVDALTVEELILSFLRRAIERAGERGAPAEPPSCPPAVRRAVEYIHAHYAASLSLDGISRAAGVSKFHLHRLFGAAVGMPMHRYLLDVRLGRAMRSLRVGHSPSLAALEAGFSDQAHLTRHLRRRFGFTPARYAAGG